MTVTNGGISSQVDGAEVLIDPAGSNALVWDMTPEIPHPAPLLDAETRRRLPALYATEKLGDDAIAQVKFFTPDSDWSWYATEFDGTDLLFGLVVGLEMELGYFSLLDLEAVRGPLGLPIERDLHFEPTTVGELVKRYRALGYR